MKKFVHGATGQFGQLGQGYPSPLFGGHSIQHPCRIPLECRLGIAGVQKRFAQGLSNVIVVPGRAFALHQPMGGAEKTARRRFGPGQPHGDVVVFLKALGKRLEQERQQASIGQHHGCFGQFFFAQTSNRFTDVLAFCDHAAAVDPVHGRRVLRKAMAQGRCRCAPFKHLLSDEQPRFNGVMLDIARIAVPSPCQPVGLLVSLQELHLRRGEGAHATDEDVLVVA